MDRCRARLLRHRRGLYSARLSARHGPGAQPPAPNGVDDASGPQSITTCGAPASRRINSVPSPAWPPSGRPCRRRTHRRNCAVTQPSCGAPRNANPHPHRRISAVLERRSHRSKHLTALHLGSMSPRTRWGRVKCCGEAPACRAHAARDGAPSFVTTSRARSSGPRAACSELPMMDPRASVFDWRDRWQSSQRPPAAMSSLPTMQKQCRITTVPRKGR